VLLKAWSVRFMALAILFAGFDSAMPYLYGLIPVPDGVFGALSGLATVLALVSRHVDQKEI
jgi:hypothetical protein